MPRKSFADGLPSSFRRELDRLIVEKKLSIDQLRDFIASCDAVDKAPGRSSVGDYAKKVRDEAKETAAALRESREITSAIAQQLGPENLESDQGRLLVEMLRTIFFRFIREKTKDPDEPLGPDAFAKMARALRDMSQAMQFEQDFAKKIRDEARKEMEAEMKTRVEKFGKAEDLKKLSNEELDKKIATLLTAG